MLGNCVQCAWRAVEWPGELFDGPEGLLGGTLELWVGLQVQ